MLSRAGVTIEPAAFPVTGPAPLPRGRAAGNSMRNSSGSSRKARPYPEHQGRDDTSLVHLATWNIQGKPVEDAVMVIESHLIDVHALGIQEAPGGANDNLHDEVERVEALHGATGCLVKVVGCHRRLGLILD